MKLTDYIIDQYFKKPNYWTIDGKPYFSVFDAPALINGLGGIENAKAALKSFEEKTTKAGFRGLHLNLIDQNITDQVVKDTYGKRQAERRF
jgi:hypothetical protein